MHGNLNRVLTFSQANVLVNSDGRACIAGLRSAHAPIDTAPAADGYRTFPGIAPELVDPERWGFRDTAPTTHSDVYALAVLAWEVRIEHLPLGNKLLNGAVCVARFSQDKPRSPARVPWRGFTRC